MAPKPRYTHCEDCGKPRSEVGGLNRSGRCFPCGQAAMVESMQQLHRHEGPYYDAWRVAMIKFARHAEGEGVG